MVQVGVESENGWRPAKVSGDALEWITVPGTNPPVTLKVMKGLPSVVMRAFAADYNAYVEPLRDGDSASWTPTNSVATSNHLNGTGMDLNWDGPEGAKVFRYGISKERAYPGDMARRQQELMDWYEGIIYCGGNWSIRDWMHYQMGYRTWNEQDRVRDFISRKIRADGFSTYKRDSTVPQNPSRDLVDILARATGMGMSRAAALLPTIQFGLKAAECTSWRRIAYWLAQIGHESDGFNATEEYKSGDESTDRWKYKGRTWIQITWRSNYLGFSQWCHKRGWVPSADYFVQYPKQLADMKWAALGPAWYWTVARANINALCDAGDFREVTRLINGGYNGMPDREARLKRASAVGVDNLLALISDDEDDMAQVPQDQWDRVFREQTQEHESLSPYRTPNEGKVGTWCRIDRNKDLMMHVLFVEHSAVTTGDVDSIYRVVRSAAGLGADTSQPFVQRAKQVMAKIPTEFLQPALAAIEAEDPDVLRKYLEG